MPMPAVGSSGQTLLVSIPPSVDLFGPPMTLAQATRLAASPFLALLLTLAMTMVSQLVKYLIKGTIKVVEKVSQWGG